MRLHSPRRDHTTRGQGPAEYVIVLAILGIAAIGIITLFGDSVRVMLGLTVAKPQGPEVEAQPRSRRAPAPGVMKQPTDFGSPDAG